MNGGITRSEVDKAVNLIVAYMQQERKWFEEKVSRGELFGDGEHSNLASTICHEILDASGRDDWGGCPLCRS